MGTQPHARRTTTMADEAATTTFATADAWLQRTYMVAEPTHECRNLMAIIQVDPKLQDIYGCLVNPQLKNCFACPSQFIDWSSKYDYTGTSRAVLPSSCQYLRGNSKRISYCYSMKAQCPWECADVPINCQRIYHGPAGLALVDYFEQPVPNITDLEAQVEADKNDPSRLHDYLEYRFLDPKTWTGTLSVKQNNGPAYYNDYSPEIYNAMMKKRLMSKYAVSRLCQQLPPNTCPRYCNVVSDGTPNEYYDPSVGSLKVLGGATTAAASILSVVAVVVASLLAMLT